MQASLAITTAAQKRGVDLRFYVDKKGELCWNNVTGDQLQKLLQDDKFVVDILPDDTGKAIQKVF